ncbi:alpha/beta fold hydrolase [Actinoplanes sp. CA-252034]|uniref:alpha/beta fold hydrolase n=1 Tax=Actinoplanes sp. CA-252034 TaxID=3239906 RepID=UPI003D999ED1
MHPRPPRRTTHAFGTPEDLLVYDRWGCSGRPVVLLHGLGYDRSMWWPTAAELGDDITALAVDLPGHGQSAPRDHCGLDDLAQDLAMLVHGLDLRRAPILIAHAEAAYVATRFAARYSTHRTITVGCAGSARLDDVPEPYRQFAIPHQIPNLLDAYREWPADALPRSTHPGAEHFPHLRDPAGFAALLHNLR